MKKILNAPTSIIVDKINGGGSTVYTCQFTGLAVIYGEHILLGAVVPNTKGVYVCHPSAVVAWKASKRVFDSVDRNCNTCAHLVRVKFDKQPPAALHSGVCSNHPYLPIIKFHPDDSMNMSCWKSRS